MSSLRPKKFFAKLTFPCPARCCKRVGSGRAILAYVFVELKRTVRENSIWWEGRCPDCGRAYRLEVTARDILRERVNRASDEGDPAVGALT